MKDSHGNVINVGDEVVHSNRTTCKRGVITHIDNTDKIYSRWVVVHFFEKSIWTPGRGYGMIKKNDKAQRSEVRTSNILKVS